MAMKPGRVYRDFFSAEFEETEDQGFIVRGYATTFNDPYVLWRDQDGTEYREMIAAGALDGADMSDVIFLYNHAGMVYARNRRTETLGLLVDESGLKVEADLRLLKDYGAGELYEAIRTGLVDRMSWAFTIRKDHYDERTRTRVIDSVEKVYDVSAVSIPADPNTDISARAYYDGVIAQAEAERLKRERLMTMIRAKTL